jgi:hypothetical protein
MEAEFKYSKFKPFHPVKAKHTLAHEELKELLMDCSSALACWDPPCVWHVHHLTPYNAETATQQLLYHKPTNPKTFLVQLLESYKSGSGTGPRPLMADTDFRTM